MYIIEKYIFRALFKIQAHTYYVKIDKMYNFIGIIITFHIVLHILQLLSSKSVPVISINQYIKLDIVMSINFSEKYDMIFMILDRTRQKFNNMI